MAKLNGRRQLPPINLNLSETDKAYLAGCIDCDGSICISCQIDNNSGCGVHFCPQVLIVSKNKEFMEELHKIIGSKLKCYKALDHRYRKRVWRVGLRSHRDIIYFLESILPYLKLKKKQAKLVIEFCKERICITNENGFYGVPYSKRCYEIVLENRIINRKKYDKKSMKKDKLLKEIIRRWK